MDASTHSDTLTAEVGSEAIGQGIPNQYHLSGGGLTVSYYPDGVGPIGPTGATILIYEDAYRQERFSKDDVEVADVPALGTLVSGTIAETLDIGSTSFTLMVPRVTLPAGLSTATIQTEGITTIHRALAARVGHPQADSYTATELTGTANRGMLPF